MATGPNRSWSLQEASACLEARGAAQTAHPGGTLLEHLRRTADLLGTWWAPQPLLLAGLCHAAYGTDGFDQPLFDLTDRSELADLIGSGAEELVYLYGSCDRRYTYPELAQGRSRFRDRFTGHVYGPSPDRLHFFMELTFANELDLARHSRAFAKDDWPRLVPLFDHCEQHVSRAAWDTYRELRQPDPATTVVHTGQLDASGVDSDRPATQDPR